MDDFLHMLDAYGLAVSPELFQQLGHAFLQVVGYLVASLAPLEIAT